MELATFENETGEGLVTFEPWRTAGPELEADHSRWYAHLKVAGERIFEYGSPCGTCGIVFRKVGSTARRVSDAEAFQLLGALDTLPPHGVLQRLARVLEPGRYYPVIVEGTVRRIETGTPEDYFATDVVRLFGLEPPDFEQPSGPRTPYYRFGSDHALERTGRLSGPHRALVTAVVMPLHDPLQLSRERIEFWKRQQASGLKLTALSVAVVDNQAPAMSPVDDTYEYKEQFLFTICLLDGHHRIQAAEMGVPVRILSFVSRESSPMRKHDDLAVVVGKYAR